MSNNEGKAYNPQQDSSDFLKCLMMSEDCPFFSSSDPNLFYFGVAITATYAVIILIMLSDLKFNWATDRLTNCLETVSNVIRSKIRNVEMSRRRLVSMRERAAAQCQRVTDGHQLSNALRRLAVEDPDLLLSLIQTVDKKNSFDDPSYEYSNYDLWPS